MSANLNLVKKTNASIESVLKLRKDANRLISYLQSHKTDVSDMQKETILNLERAMALCWFSITDEMFQELK